MRIRVSNVELESGEFADLDANESLIESIDCDNSVEEIKAWISYILEMRLNKRVISFDWIIEDD